MKTGWTGLQVLVVALCFAINMVDGMDVLVMTYVAPALGEQLGVSPARLGVLFSAGLAGMAIGGILVAPLADRFGRRPLITAGLATMTIAMIASGFADGVGQLMILRLVVGTGIGTVLAGMSAMVAEFAPSGRRSFAVAMLQAGYPLGAMFTGFAAASAVPRFGWQPVLLGAGVISAVLLPAVAWLMPESLAFLLRRRPAGGLATANRVLARLGRPDMVDWPSDQGPAARFGVAGLVAEGRLASTLLLWAAIVAGFMTLYFIISWITKLAILAGLDEAHGIYAGAILNLGSLSGTLALGWLSGRVRLQRLVFAFLLLAALALTVFGAVRMPLAPLLGMAFAIGFFLQGGFNGLYPLAAAVYPPEARSSGLGWAMGVGRIGAVAGPMVGGLMVGAKTPLPVVFAVFSAPVLVAGLCALFVHSRVETEAGG